VRDGDARPGIRACRQERQSIDYAAERADTSR
jgi:hypothetical protein